MCKVSLYKPGIIVSMEDGGVVLHGKLQVLQRKEARGGANSQPMVKAVQLVSPNSDADEYVATCDGDRAISRDAAIALADRLYFLGFFGLPWLWVLNAWTFSPHLRASPDDPGYDARVAARARSSRALAWAAHVVLVAWAATFYFGGREIFGAATWERLSATTQQL